MALVLKELNYVNSVKVIPSPAEKDIFFSEQPVYRYDWLKKQGELLVSHVQETRFRHQL